MPLSFHFSRENSFLRESLKLYVLYMVAGLSAIPAGILYAILTAKGYGGLWVALSSIVLGFWMAKEAWNYVNLKFFTPAITASGAIATWSLELVPVAAVAVVILSLPPGLLAAHNTTFNQPTGTGSIVTNQPEAPGQCSEPVLTVEFRG